MRRFLHRISHWLGWNTGMVETWWAHGRLMVGFRCDQCGELTGVHPCPRHISHPEERQ